MNQLHACSQIYSTDIIMTHAASKLVKVVTAVISTAKVIKLLKCPLYVVNERVANE